MNILQVPHLQSGKKNLFVVCKRFGVQLQLAPGYILFSKEKKYIQRYPLTQRCYLLSAAKIEFPVCFVGIYYAGYISLWRKLTESYEVFLQHTGLFKHELWYAYYFSPPSDITGEKESHIKEAEGNRQSTILAAQGKWSFAFMHLCW